MGMNTQIDLPQFSGKQVTNEHEEKLRKVAASLQIREDDAVWQLLEAMEYQRFFYEKLPKHIENTSETLLKNLKEAADIQVAQSKNELTKEVVEQARTLAVKLSWGKILPYILGGIVAILIFGVLMIWLGYCVGLGKPFPLEKVWGCPS